MLIEDKVVPQDINLNSVVQVKAGEDRKATIVIPKELRLTQELIGLLNQAVQAQGLELSHVEIAQEHLEELKTLSNVVLQEKEQPE